MRLVLHAAGLVLLVLAAVIQFRWFDGTAGWNALGFGLFGLACWCASGLPAYSSPFVVQKRPLPPA